MNKDNAINNAKITNIFIEWYVLHYTPGFPNQATISKQILSKTPTELQYVERSVVMKEVRTQSVWTFELITQEKINVPMWTFVSFQQPDRQDSQSLKNNTFYRPPVTSAQCVISTEKYSDSGILLKYNDDNISPGYGQTKEAFRALTKDDVLKPYISEHCFRSSKDDNDIGYNIYVFDIGYQKNLESAQTIKVVFKFSENFPAGINGFALFLMNKLVSESSDVHRRLDLI